MLLSILPSLSVCVAFMILPCVIGSALYYIFRVYYSRQFGKVNIPVSVNYHLSRKCNYQCGFCFHTDTTSETLSLAEARRGLKLLKDAGMRKLNLAGGEPFLYPRFMQELIRYGKVDLQIESISIVSNGSKIREKFLRENAPYIDIIAISCDSLDAETNIRIGRGKHGRNVEQLKKVAGWCQQFGIKFKINTVVCSLNWDEDMAAMITELQPFRWKVFQCLIVTGENDNEMRKRDARSFLVSDWQWEAFCDRHNALKCFVPESNKAMKGSYLILDEYMRFLDKGDGEELASESILDVGVLTAMAQVRWDRTAFVNRGGLYDWTRSEEMKCCLSDQKAASLDW